MGFHTLHVETSLNSIKTEARACLTTNDPIMTSVSLENTIVSRFECDNAASHSVMAKDVFMELIKKLGGTEGFKQDVTVKLADGSAADKDLVLGTVQVHV